MWRFGLKQAGRLALGLAGAILLAAFVSAFSAGSAGSFGSRVFAGIAAIGTLHFGESSISDQSAWAELSQSLPATLELVGLGAAIALLVGGPMGILLSSGSLLRAGAPLIQIVAAAPVFCAGLGLLWLSDRLLQWDGAPRELSLFAAIAKGDPAILANAIRAVALPALTVGAAGAAGVQLILRRAIGRAAGEPYRRGLRAMGLGRFEIDRLYLVPQVAAALLENLGMIASSLLAAAAVAEWVFAWPGAAGLFLKSVALHDWTVVGLVLLVFAALTMSAEFIGAVGARLLAETGSAQ